MIRTITLALLAAALPHAAAAQPSPPARMLTQYALDRWDDRSGLPQNSVQALAQTRDGYLWLGTQAGVVRFDGVRFTTFGRDAGPALSHPYIWSLAADPDGSLWVGTEETGLVHLKDGRFTAYGTAQGLPDPWVNALLKDRRGTLWIGTMEGGLARLRGGRITPVAGVPGRAVFAIAEDAGGAVWVGTNAGLTRIEGERTRTFGPAELGARSAGAVIPARRGGVWAGTPNGVLRLVDGRVVERYTAAEGLPGPARQLAEDDDGTLWIAGSQGLARLAGGRIEPAPERLMAPAPVEALLADREGNLWIGTSGTGLHRLADSPILPFGTLEGLPSDAVFPVLQDRAGALWAGVGPAGLAHVDAGGRVRHLGAASGALRDDFIFSMAQDREGALWLGGPAGLTRMKDGASTHFGAAEGVPRPTLVRAILAGRDGRLWLGTEAGVTRFRPGPPVTYGPREGLAEGFVTTLYEDTDGAIWAGTRRGLTRIAGGRLTTWTRRNGLPEGDVTALHRGSDGALWIGTGAGLARLKDGRISVLTSANGLCDDEIHAVTEDGRGRLWLSANRGVFALSLAGLNAALGARAPRLSCTLYGRAEGMRSRETNGAVNPAVVRMRDGRIVFPTMGGLVFIDPERLARPLAPPAVAIEEVRADNRLLARPGVVPAGTQELEVHFTALSFQAPEKIQFRYRLEGLERAWTLAGTRRTAFYTHLPAGAYRLVVQARHPGGAWGPAGAPLPLQVMPQLHETQWFQAFALLGVLLLLAGAYRLRTRTLRARERALLAVIDERTRAEARFRDLFDNATDAVLITDADGRITALNRRAREMTGYAEAAGMELRALLAPEVADAAVREWLGGTGDAARMVEMVAADGTRIPVEVSTRVVHEGGVAVGTQAVARDVRERMALEQQLREAQKMEAVGQLAGGVAHDFNNLLTIIRGGSELMLCDLAPGDPMREDVQMVLAASERAEGLTRQLLAFSRRQMMQPRRVDVNALVTGLEPMLRRLIGEDIHIASSTCAAEAWVTADPGQLEQVLVNLAVNARDAMPGGGRLTLRTELLDECACSDAPLGTPLGPCVLVTVTDTGVGMDAATHARIFEPFFTTKELGRGTGLGLSTVYGIVRQAGGTVQCLSRPGAGTSFLVRLPFAGAAAADGAVPAAASAGTGPAGSETVLLVEDEAPVRAMAARILRRHGYQVLETRGGSQALKAARLHAGPIHLLVTDVVMPEMNGRVLAERLAQRHPEMRVLYMSGYTDDEILRRGLLRPGVHYLQKPFSVDALSTAVRARLDTDGYEHAWQDEMAAAG